MFKILFSMFYTAFFGMSFAKVEGPLFSLEARGQVGKALVYFPWKGRHVVRGYVSPANPKSALQGYVRVALKAISKWVKKVGNTSDGDALDSKVYVACTSKAPAGLNWNAFIGAGFLDKLQLNGTYKTGSFTDYVDVYSSLNTTDIAAWASEASALGLEDLSFNYGYTTNIPAGMQLYFGAIACYQQEIIATAPYNTDVASRVLADITDFAEEMTRDA